MATNPNGRSKMSREERAKQFMPFSALKGYEEALRAKELEFENKAKEEYGKKKVDSDMES